MEKMVHISFQVLESEKRAFEAIAKERERFISRPLQGFVRRYIARHGGKDGEHRGTDR